MSENGKEERKRALEASHGAVDALREAKSPFAAIDALREAENTVLAAEDAHQEAWATKSAALSAQYEAEKDLLKPEIPLDDALERVRVTTQRHREARLAVIGEDGTQPCLNEAKDARDEALDEAVKRMDPYRKLLDEVFSTKDHCNELVVKHYQQLAEQSKREAVNPVVETNDVLNREDTKAEAAPEELHDTDEYVTDVLLDVLGDKSRAMMPPERLIAEMRTVVDAQRAQYPTIKTFRIVEWTSLRESLLRLDRLGYFVVTLSETVVKFGRGPQLIVEPEPGFPEEGKCLNDVGNPNCLGVTTKGKHSKWKGKHYPRCKPCNDIFQERRDAKPVKAEPEPDDSGTLFETPEPAPEPVPVPVPASTVMLEAKPVDIEPAELVTKSWGNPAVLNKIGHWHSTRYTVAAAEQLTAGRAHHGEAGVLWAIMTILEGLGVDRAKIPNVLLNSISGLKSPKEPIGRLVTNGIIIRDAPGGGPAAYYLAPGFARSLEDDTTEHSTRFTVALTAQLSNDGVTSARRNVLWVCMALVEGASGDSTGIPALRIANVIGVTYEAAHKHLRALKDLGYVKYDNSFLLGLGSRLTNE